MTCLPAILSLGLALAAGGGPDWREGDILFHTSRSSQSKAIRLATRSPFSHVGVLVKEGNEWMVLEAVQPVKLTPVDEWIRRGEGRRVTVKRLKEAERYLTAEALARMKSLGKSYLGRPYDLAFEWTDQRLYCSELVWKLYKAGTGLELGALQRLKDFDLSHPAVRRKLVERYGQRLPVDEPVISPGTMADSPLLETVWTR